jgi:2-dehydropantoate 2-reductase
LIGPLGLVPVRLVIYGAGAVGGVLGARLAEAGHDVAVIARGAHLEAIQRDGLRVRSPDGERTVRLAAVADPGELSWSADTAVLLAMKSMDTEAALRALVPHAHPDTAVVCVQNGVANERAALRVFGNVYGVCVMFPTSHLTPGVVVAHSAPVPGILDLGRYPHGCDATAQRLVAAVRSAGFHAEPREDIMRWKYAKLLMNLGNALDALCGRSSDLADAVAPVRAEGEAVLRTAGIGFVSREEDRRRRGDILQIAPVSGADRAGGSSWQSLARGTGTVESDYLNGEIVLLGRLHGVPTPANELARSLANRSAREGRSPGWLTPTEFRTLLAGR